MSDQPAESSMRVRLWPVLKLIFFAVMLTFVGRRAYRIWESAPKDAVEIQGSWLILASVVYFVAWMPSVWFWRELLLHLKQPLSFWDAFQAYYIGNMGKYVPGKALVLVIRGSLVKHKGINPFQAGAAAAYETLVFMGIGGALALAFAPFAFVDTPMSRTSEWLIQLHQYQILWPIAVMVLTFATTPVSAWLFTKFSQKLVPAQPSDTESPPAFTAVLICKGAIASLLGWICQALSLGFVLQSISQQEFDWSHFTLWLASISLSTISGFIVLIAPGGLGAREGMMIETLKDQPQIGAQAALIAAGLMRAVGFLTEVIAAAIFLLMRRRSRPR